MTKKNKTPNSIWVLSGALACIGAGQSTIFILIPQEIRSLVTNLDRRWQKNNST